MVQDHEKTEAKHSSMIHDIPKFGGTVYGRWTAHGARNISNCRADRLALSHADPPALSFPLRQTNPQSTTKSTTNVFGEIGSDEAITGIDVQMRLKEQRNITEPPPCTKTKQKKMDDNRFPGVPGGTIPQSNRFSSHPTIAVKIQYEAPCFRARLTTLRSCLYRKNTPLRYSPM